MSFVSDKHSFVNWAFSDSETMDSIEYSVRSLLQGSAYEQNSYFCDFDLADQNDLLASKGLQRDLNASKYRPVVGKSVTYIVAAVIFNGEREVLMMQEAKSSCAGQWYLPAGRIDPGEDLEEAIKRRVQDETGLDFEPTSLLSLEIAAGSWFRFVFTGEVSGGRLKTPADADSESLQAKWVGDLGELSLRAEDVGPLVERGRMRERSRKSGLAWHGPLLPALRSHTRLYLRLVIVGRKRTSSHAHVLVSEKSSAHLPLCEINPLRNIHSTLKKYMREIFGSDPPPHRPHGLLALEHCGKPLSENDGLCLTLLVSVRIPLEEVCLIDKYSWFQLEKTLGQTLLSRLAKNMTIALVVIR